MDKASGPEDLLREALQAMPPWARRMVAMVAGADPDGADWFAAVDDIWSGRGQGDDGSDRADDGSGRRPGTGRPSPGPWAGGGRQRHGRPGRSAPPWVTGGLGRALFEGWQDPWGTGRARAGRGDVRSAILALLAEEPMHGYQLMQEMSERSGGAWRPSPGSIYPTLSQLEEEGLVEGSSDGGRRVFTLTEAGRDAAAAADDEGDKAPWDSVGERADADAGHPAAEDDDDTSDLRHEAAATATAVEAVAATGGPDQLAAATAIMADARRALFRLLAES